MPTPLPDQSEVLLEPPDAREAQLTAQGVATAVAPSDGLTPLQRVLIQALWPAMTSHQVDLDNFERLSASQLGQVLRRRNLAFRTRVVQLMLLTALVLRPFPLEVAERITACAIELAVDEEMIPVARRFAEGSLGLAAFDFERNGYTRDWTSRDRTELHTSRELASAWDLATDDPELAGQWAALERLPADSLGFGVWKLYRARGFAFPGTTGSAPPLLAQHDWVHVLADYGTTVENELEVFAFIARANDDMRAFSLLAMVVSLFETGYLRTGAGLFEASPGHLGESGVATRLADAMRRGALCHDVVTGSSSIDFMAADWFDLAGQSINDVRWRFSVAAKSASALAAGSVGPWEAGGISSFQLDAGKRLAEREGRRYESFGAQVLERD